MTTGAKMLLMANRSGGQGRGNRGGRSEMRGEMQNRGEMENGMEMGYGGMEEMENRRRRYRRDSRGRFRSEMEMGGGYGEMEMRRGGSGGRNEMGYNGMEMEPTQGDYGRSEMENRRGNQGGNQEMRGVYPYRPFPVYEERGRVNQIGFDAGGGEINTNYRMNATHKSGNEMEYRQSSQMGGYSSSKGAPMTKEMAEEWTRSMKNEDGTKGPHWTMDQVKQVMGQKGIKYDPAEFYAILNAMYSDYCAVLKKHGVNTIDFYVDLASAWLNDSDAVPNKAAMYYECIVKHE